MENVSLSRLLAEVALAGSGHHCQQESATIADWLETQPDTKESVALIRMMNLMNHGEYEAALSLPNVENYEALSPFLALCEWHLGLTSQLDQRLDLLAQSDNPELSALAPLLRNPTAE